MQEEAASLLPDLIPGATRPVEWWGPTRRGWRHRSPPMLGGDRPVPVLPGKTGGERHDATGLKSLRQEP